MWQRLNPLICLLVLAACSGNGEGPPATIAPGEGAETPSGAVDGLVEALNSGDFTGASHLAMPTHAALAALAEGASFGEVADALANGDQSVAANFWAGFAQGAGSFLTGPISTVEGQSIEKEGLEFRVIEVTPADGAPRPILVRDADGYRIDLFASFGNGLADKMGAPTERLLSAQTDDARMILGSLQDIVPSLFVASELPGTPTAVAQQLTSLIEIITRVG